ncbi:MAG: DUF29 domain-containing protein [Devosia sp.]
MNKVELKSLTSIDDDFALWAAEQAALVRSGRLDRLDTDNVAEELEGLGRSEEHQIDSRLEVLIAHLLKWQFQPAKRKHGWKASIDEQRIRLTRILRKSPSLRAYPAESLRGSFVIGRNQAISETGLDDSAFPQTCPYTVEQVLDADFFPD